MQLTVEQLIGINEPIQRLAAAKLEARAAFRVALLVKKLTPPLAAAMEARLSIYKRFGEENADGSVIVSPPRIVELKAALAPLLAETVDVQVEPIPIDLLAGVDVLTVADMMALGPILAE
jgi:hypothetical protein